MEGEGEGQGQGQGESILKELLLMDFDAFGVHELDRSPRLTLPPTAPQRVASSCA